VKAVALDGAHRAHAQQLRVVAQPQLARQLGKRLIEDELAVTVALQIERCDGDQRLAAPDPQVEGLPALTGHDAAGSLQALEPVPGVEGKA
jgi:hypothetical protein